MSTRHVRKKGLLFAENLLNAGFNRNIYEKLIQMKKNSLKKNQNSKKNIRIKKI